MAYWGEGIRNRRLGKKIHKYIAMTAVSSVFDFHRSGKPGEFFGGGVGHNHDGALLLSRLSDAGSVKGER